ncbi:MAG: hypothetical protein HYR68_00840 [Burkholderiales bacterium]|nr:hypothetical protein [Burkholderiales bacterium]MBI3727611.1 hypothetical protein [Burkholderiales bacterium]
MNEKQLRAELDAVYSSLSWKITAPFRCVTRTISSIKTIKFSVRSLPGRIVRRVVAITAIKNLALRILKYFPGIERRVRKGLQPRLAPQVSAGKQVHRPSKRSGDARLSAKAQIIFDKLQTEIIRQE